MKLKDEIEKINKQTIEIKEIKKDIEEAYKGMK